LREEFKKVDDEIKQIVGEEEINSKKLIVTLKNRIA